MSDHPNGTYRQDTEHAAVSVTVTGFRYFIPPAHDLPTDTDQVVCEVLPSIFVREPLAVLEQWEADLGRAINRIRAQRVDARPPLERRIPGATNPPRSPR